MTDNTGPRLVSDDALDRALRVVHAAPEDAAYWDGLHTRIMARVRAGETLDAWWLIPAPVRRVGLIAAALALVVGGSLLLRERAVDRQLAYDTVMEPTDTVPQLAIRDQGTERDAALRYLNGR